MPRSETTISLWNLKSVATFDAGVIPDLLDESILAVEAKLHDEIDQGVQETPHVLRLQRLSGFGLLHEQHDLPQGQARCRAVNTRDRPGVRGNYAEVIEGLLAA